MNDIIETTRLEELTPNTIHPLLLDQWRRIVGQIVDAFEDETDALDRAERKARITLKVDLACDMKTRAVTVTAQMDARLPGPRAVTQWVRMPRGTRQLLVEVDLAEQLNLYQKEANNDE